MASYRLINHTADLAAYFYGTTPEDLLANAGRALFKVMLERPPRRGTTKSRLVVAGTDLADLLNRFLSELLYLFQVKRLIVCEVAGIEFTRSVIPANHSPSPDNEVGDQNYKGFGHILGEDDHQTAAEGFNLKVDLTVMPFDLDRHGLKTDIKAVTYHQIEFRSWRSRWRGKVIFDL